MIGHAYCIDCGHVFLRQDGETWKTRCVRCWKKAKGIDYFVALPRAQDELAERLPKLLQLCHPDKHGGSALATETTQWLLQVRAELVQEEVA